jgi:hypothetical protein
VNQVALLKFVVGVAAVVGAALLATGPNVAPEAHAQDAKTKVISLQSYNYPKTYVRHRDFLGETTEINSELDRKDASFYLMPGLADGNLVSFRSLNNPKHYLRHQEGRLKLHELEDADLFRKDATFRRVDGLANKTWYSFESLNFPGHYIRHKNAELWVEKNDGTELFREDATFFIVDALQKPE